MSFLAWTSTKDTEKEDKSFLDLVLLGFYSYFILFEYISILEVLM